MFPIMPSVVLVGPDGDEVVVEDQPTFVQLVWGDGYRPKVGSVNDAYRALSGGPEPVPDANRPITARELVIAPVAPTSPAPGTVWINNAV